MKRIIIKTAQKKELSPFYIFHKSLIITKKLLCAKKERYDEVWLIYIPTSKNPRI